MGKNYTPSRKQFSILSEGPDGHDPYIWAAYVIEIYNK